MGSRSTWLTESLQINEQNFPSTENLCSESNVEVNAANNSQEFGVPLSQLLISNQGLTRLSFEQPEGVEDQGVEDVLIGESPMVFDLPSLYEVKLKEKREWMERLDVSEPIANFSQLVPHLAHQFPFELDIFQQQVGEVLPFISLTFTHVHVELP